MVVIWKFLAPLRRQAEAQGDKAKTNDHIPGSDIRNGVLGRRYIKDDDPNQACNESADHGGSKPPRALGRNWRRVSD